MSLELLETTINELIKNKVFQVVLTGGECLLVKNALLFGIDKLIHGGIDCTLNSNLILVQKSDATSLYKAGLRGILTSVSSYKSQVNDSIFCHRGALKKTVKGIHICMGEGIDVAVSMVVMKENVKDVIPTGLMLKSIGVKKFFATKASPPLNAIRFQDHMINGDEMLSVIEDLNVLRTQYGMDVGVLECYPLCSHGLPQKYPFVSDRRCSAGITTVTIGSNGEIRPCSHSDKVYGNIMRDGLRKSWKAMGEQRDGSLLPEVCKKCSLFAHCSGGCRVDALYCSGKYDSLDPYARPDLVKNITVEERDVGLIPDTQKLYVNQRLKFRTESIGIMCADPKLIGMPIILTKDTYDIIKLLSGKVFQVKDVCNLTGLSCDEARGLCSVLIKDKVLQIEDSAGLAFSGVL